LTTFKTYLKAAVISNVFLYLMISLFPLFNISDSTINTWWLLYAATLSGGAIGGALITLETGDESILNGSAAGALSYILYLVTTFWISHGFMQDVVALTGFIVGASLGVKLWGAYARNRGASRALIVS
jgi:hypothetical protein